MAEGTMTQKEMEDYWGKPIYSYTDTDAIEDGTLVDITVWNLRCPGNIVRPINRMTHTAVKEIMQIKNSDSMVEVRGYVESIVSQLRIEGDFAKVRSGDHEFYVVKNETGKYTFMNPRDY